MAVLAVPLIVGSTREALQALPSRLREGSFALGKTRASTIWHVLLPSARPGIASGVALGMGRIVGDTAIVRFHWVAEAETIPEGKKSFTNLHILMIWQKQGGEWKLLARASTKL